MYKEHRIKHLRKHRNVLYGIVVVLLILQIASFVSISLQISRIDSQQTVIKEDVDKYVSDLESQIDNVRQENQFGINSIALEIFQQKKDIDSQISLLKASQEDFSGVIEDVIPGVVSVLTDRSAGSGFAVKEGGYIVTNFHE